MPIKKTQVIFFPSATVPAGGPDSTGASFDLRALVRVRILGTITNAGNPTTPAVLRVETAMDNGSGAPGTYYTFKRAFARNGNNDVTPFNIPLDDATQWARVVIEFPTGVGVTAVFDGSAISQIG